MKLLLITTILFSSFFILVYSFDPSRVILAIDCGSSSHQSSSLGFTYQPDDYYNGGFTFERIAPISMTQNQAPYQTIRYSKDDLQYLIPVKDDSSYVLILQFSDILGAYIHKWFVIKIGNYTVKPAWELKPYTWHYYAYDIFVEFNLSSGSVYINGSPILGAYKNGKIQISFMPDRNLVHIAGIILVKGDCSAVDNCSMCYGLKCSKCNYPYYLTCASCIENASLNDGVCNCNSNMYDSVSNTCVTCDDQCESCYGSSPFQCKSCPSSYYLVSNICLKTCPYGFLSPCSAVSEAAIDISFAGHFNGIYEIFRTGDSENNYYFFNSPENVDPIPAKNRGLYFSGGAYLETIPAVYFSPSFSIGLWVWISPGSGNLFTHSNSRVKVTETGALKILLENHLVWTLYITTKSLSPPNSEWVYLSYVVAFSSPSTTITSYLNSISKEVISQSEFVYRDLEDSTITLGKSLESSFKGFIYQFQLWNSAVPNFNAQYFDQICGKGKVAACLWSCDISSWISKGEVFPCDDSCSTGCSRKGTCNICDDPLCSICRGFSRGLCDQCVPNASGIPCSCNEGSILSDSGVGCISLSTKQPSCNEGECMLSENIIYNENLMSSEWVYYKAPFYQGHKNVTLIINSDFSDLQVYINLNSDNKKPSSDSFDYFFDGLDGKLKITLALDLIGYANCNSELQGHHGPEKQCAYHIGIFSTLGSLFSIKFKTTPIIPKLISIGNPITSNMTELEHNFYSGIIDANSPLIVKVNNQLGRASTYISLFDYELAEKDPSKWPIPSKSENSYTTSKAFDKITIGKENLISICPSQKCLIKICEICWNQPCIVELSLLNQTYRFIKPSTYYNGTVCLDCFHYYDIPFYFGHKTIKIILMPISPNLDLYVALNTNNKNPDTNTYDYKLQRIGAVSEELTLTFDSIAEENCPKSHEEASSWCTI